MALNLHHLTFTVQLIKEALLNHSDCRVQLNSQVTEICLTERQRAQG